MLKNNTNKIQLNPCETLVYIAISVNIIFPASNVLLNNMTVDKSNTCNFWDPIFNI